MLASLSGVLPFSFFIFPFKPMDESSFARKLGVLEKSAAKSSFIIEFVGMFGFSFSNPPCIKMVESIDQTVCLNL